MLIQNYISRTIIYATLLVLVVLLGLVFLFSLLSELGNVGKGEYGLLQTLFFVLLDMPFQMYTLFPMTALIGSLVGLGFLASHSELIVMRASGFSTTRIMMAVFIAASALTLLATLMGELLAPKSEHLAGTQKAMAISAGQTLSTKRGTWIREGQTFVHIRAILPGKILENIHIYQFDNHQHLIMASYAKRAEFQADGWLLKDIKQSKISEERVTSTVIASQHWNLHINPTLLAITSIDPDSMTLIKLWEYSRYLQDNGRRSQSQEYSFAFWKRAFQPLATLVMIFLAVPFVFGSQRTITMGLRMVIGISIGLLFYILNQFFGPISLVYQIPPIVAAALPTVLFAMGGMVLWKVMR
ncbi:LPS export ABC transporter permease LptG [soil metagenome]